MMNAEVGTKRNSDIMREVAVTMREAHAPWPEHVEDGCCDQVNFFAALADMLDSEAHAWDAAYEEYWSMMARAWDKNNDAAMSDEMHQHSRNAAAEYADGIHRPALRVARAYGGRNGA